MAYNPSDHAVIGKALGPTGDSPATGRQMYYDKTVTPNKYRAFVSTAELIAYCASPAQRQATDLYLVNTGGSLSAGVITGGINSLWHWKDNKTDGGLVQLLSPDNIPQDSTHRFVSDAEKDDWNSGTSSSPVEQTLTDGATIIWDLDLGSYAKVTLGGNRSLVLSNATAPAAGILEVTQGSGGNSLSLPGNTPADFSFSSGAGEKDILGFIKNSSGVFWSVDNYGTVAGLIELDQPTLLMTVDDDDKITFDITDIDNESGYTYQIATDLGFSLNLQTYNASADETTHQFTGLNSGTVYYGRVKGDGDLVTYSDSDYGVDSATTTGSAGFDVDAAAYFAAHLAAGGTLTTPQKIQISNGFAAAKTAGIFSKYVTVYRWGGNVAAAGQINIVNPGTLDASIVGTATVNDGFVGNGTTGHVIGLTPSVDIASNKIAISYLSGDDNYTDGGFDFGCGPHSVDNRSSLWFYAKEAHAAPGARLQLAWNAIYVNTANATTGIDVYTMYFDQSTDAGSVYEGATLMHTNTDAGQFPDVPLAFAACNGRYSAPGIQGFTTRKFNIMAVADDLAPSENTAHLAFMAALNNF